MKKIDALILAFVISSWASFGVGGFARQFIGGEARFGKVEGSRYYTYSQGRYTEVSRWMFYLSKAHSAYIVITGPISVVCGLVWMALFTRRTPRREQDALLKQAAKRYSYVSWGVPTLWVLAYLVCAFIPRG